MTLQKSNTSQFKTFDSQCGRGKMFQLFGNEMNEIINEHNEVLAA